MATHELTQKNLLLPQLKRASFQTTLPVIRVRRRSGEQLTSVATFLVTKVLVCSLPGPMCAFTQQNHAEARIWEQHKLSCTSMISLSVTETFPCCPDESARAFRSTSCCSMSVFPAASARVFSASCKRDTVKNKKHQQKCIDHYQNRQEAPAKIEILHSKFRRSTIKTHKKHHQEQKYYNQNIEQAPLKKYNKHRQE